MCCNAAALLINQASGAHLRPQAPAHVPHGVGHRRRHHILLQHGIRWITFKCGRAFRAPLITRVHGWLNTPTAATATASKVSAATAQQLRGSAPPAAPLPGCPPQAAGRAWPPAPPAAARRPWRGAQSACHLGAGPPLDARSAPGGRGWLRRAALRVNPGPPASPAAALAACAGRGPGAAGWPGRYPRCAGPGQVGCGTGRWVHPGRWVLKLRRGLSELGSQSCGVG